MGDGCSFFMGYVILWIVPRTPEIVTFLLIYVLSLLLGRGTTQVILIKEGKWENTMVFAENISQTSLQLENLKEICHCQNCWTKDFFSYNNRLVTMCPPPGSTMMINWRRRCKGPFSPPLQERTPQKRRLAPGRAALWGAPFNSHWGLGLAHSDDSPARENIPEQCLNAQMMMGNQSDKTHMATCRKTWYVHHSETSHHAETNPNHGNNKNKSQKLASTNQ